MRSWLIACSCLFTPLPPLLLLAEPGARPTEEATPFVHLQTDRPAYRRGETIWFQAHAPEAAALSVRLLDPSGKEVARQGLESREKAAAGGSFRLARDLPGGIYRLEASQNGRVAHAVALEVEELALPRALLELTILGEHHYPGKAVVAAFRARDLRGQPLRGARVEYRATFGTTAVRESAGQTDRDGRALIRFLLPGDVDESGHLAIEKQGYCPVHPRLPPARSWELDRIVPRGSNVAFDVMVRVGLVAPTDGGSPIEQALRLFSSMSSRAVSLLEEIPGIGIKFQRATIPGTRRMLLRKSNHWIYYTIDPQHAVVYVLAVWSAWRGSDPPFERA